MIDIPPEPAPEAKPARRNSQDDRRAAALKANLARRKAQTRARAGDGGQAGVESGEEQEQR